MVQGFLMAPVYSVNLRPPVSEGSRGIMVMALRNEYGRVAVGGIARIRLACKCNYCNILLKTTNLWLENQTVFRQIDTFIDKFGFKYNLFFWVSAAPPEREFK